MATQHGWWDDKGIFHPTKTKEESVASWRESKGYNPSGVFDMPGGGTIDTRNVSPSRNQSGINLQPAAPVSSPSTGIQHGWWDANNVFHATKTLEEAVAGWRLNQGYDPRGVFDMPGGQIVDTRKITPQIQETGGANAPQVSGLNTPDVGPNLPSGYRPPSVTPTPNVSGPNLPSGYRPPEVDSGYNSLRRKLDALIPPPQPEIYSQQLNPSEQAAVTGRLSAAEIASVQRARQGAQAVATGRDLGQQWWEQTVNNLAQTAQIVGDVSTSAASAADLYKAQVANNLKATADILNGVWQGMNTRYDGRVTPPSNPEISAMQQRQIEANAQADQNVQLAYSNALQDSYGGGLNWSQTIGRMAGQVVSTFARDWGANFNNNISYIGEAISGRPAGEDGNGPRTLEEAQTAAAITNLAMWSAYDPNYSIWQYGGSPEYAGHLMRSSGPTWDAGDYFRPQPNLYGPRPNVVSERAANGAMIQPKSQGLKDFFKTMWGVEGFDSVSQFMDTIGFDWNPNEQDPITGEFTGAWVPKESVAMSGGAGGGYVYSGSPYTPYVYPQYGYSNGRGSGYGAPYMSVLWRISA